MKSFKIWVTKNQKRHILIINAENEILAREKVHKEGYSILNIEENNSSSIKWVKFIFEWSHLWKIKKWKIIWNDIFKIYTKLRKDLWYNIKYLYQENNNITEEEKLKTIKNLEWEYDIFIWYQKNNNKK